MNIQQNVLQTAYELIAIKWEFIQVIQCLCAAGLYKTGSRIRSLITLNDEIDVKICQWIYCEKRE